jgi:hypothetical protein
MHPDWPAEPYTAPDGGESTGAVEHVSELREGVTGTDLPDAQAIDHLRSQEHGAAIARQCGEAVAPADNEDAE